MKSKYYTILIILILCIFYLFYINKSKDNKIFYNTTDYPEFKILEDNYKIMLNEIPEININDITYQRSREAWNNAKMDKLFEDLKYNDKWIKGFKISDNDTNNNHWFNFPLIYNNNPIGLAEKICPNTIKLLKKIPKIRVAGFSLLIPKSKIDIHADLTGPTYNSMALNLNLIGDNSSLFIKPYNSNKYLEKKHKEGKAIIFDSEQYHYAINDGNKNRIILYIDFST